MKSLFAPLDSLRKKWQSQENRAPVLFTASSLWLSAAQLISGVIIVHFVNPGEMGLWASVNLALTYAFFVLAGIQNGLSRELPYYLGANKDAEAHRLAATSLFYTIGGCALAVASGAATLFFLIWNHSDIKLEWAVAAVTLLIVFKFYQNYLFVTFRSKNSFLKLAWVQVWQGALMILALPLLFFGYGGMVLRFVVVGGVGLYLMHRVRPMLLSPAWRTQSFLLLLKTGIPIFATDYITNCAGTLDKVALLKFGGVEQVGLYALAGSAYSAFQVLPQSIAHYAYPRMSHHYGRTNNPRVLWGMAWKTTLIVVGSMLPIAIIGSMLLNPIVRALFPKYVSGVYAAQIALFTGVAYGATMGSNALASLKAWSHLFLFQLLYAGLLAIGPFIGTRVFPSPLIGVPWGMFGANLIAAFLSLIITFAATHRKESHTLAATNVTEPAAETTVTAER